MTAQLEVIRDALNYIDPDDRETWVTVGICLHAELGPEDGWVEWKTWSMRSERWIEKDAIYVWNGFFTSGGRGIGTLFWLAQQYGFRRRADYQPDPEWEARRERQRKKAEEERRELEILTAESLEIAHFILENCELRPHPYLERKGFGNKRGMVFSGNVVMSEFKDENGSRVRRYFDVPYHNVLVVPVRHPESRNLLTVQTISGENIKRNKRFMPHSNARGGTAVIGSGEVKWYAEGYSTALSVHRALKEVGIDSQVVITFYAANIPQAVVKHGDGYIAADLDLKDGKGKRYAKLSGMPYWMVPHIKALRDANDYEQEYGTLTLGETLSDFMTAPTIGRNNDQTQ